jgi:hypothetical protein
MVSALILAPAPGGPSSLLSARAAAPRFRLAAAAGNSQVNLTWTPSAPGSSFTFYEGTAPGIGKPVAPANVTVTNGSALVTGLKDGTTYYFWLAAGKVPAVVSNTASATPVTVPGAPAGLTATASDTEVRLSWTAPASAGGSPVATYKIYVATAPGVPGRAAAGSAKGTGATVAHLSNGTVYYFMVTAVNTAGKEGPFSTQVSAEPAGSGTGIRVGLASPTAPAQLIALLAAVAAMGAAAVFTLIRRRGRRSHSPAHARPARSREPVAVPSDVRAVPGVARPDVLGVRDIGQEPTHTIHLEPHPGVATTTFKGRRP